MSPNSARVPVTKQMRRFLRRIAEHVPLKHRSGQQWAPRPPPDRLRHRDRRNPAARSLNGQIDLVNRFALLDVAHQNEALAADAANILLDAQHAFCTVPANLLSDTNLPDIFLKLIRIGAGGMIRAG